MTAKALKVRVTEKGCFVTTSHALNPDGYFRKRFMSSRKSQDGIEMFHRTMWKHYNGFIPEGFEIDHLCKNRACFNVQHLRCIEGSLHASLSNTERSKKYKQLNDTH
jgi:hypothetical protein